MRRVVVCGGGMAGLCAALTAAQAGSAVTVLEKGPEIGGSARLSAGYLWTHADVDALFKLVPHGNRVLQSLLLERFGSAVAWLASLGVSIGARRKMLAYGHGWKVDPEQLLRVLWERLATHGVVVHTNTALERLRPEGVQTEAAFFQADAVVLATGGFQGNAELIERHCVPNAANVYTRANAFSTGDGFIAASAIGAAASGAMQAFYGHAMLAPPARFTSREFASVTQYQGSLGIALNLDGRRFADESAGTGEEVLNQALAQQRDGRGVYVIDARAAASACLAPDLLMTRTVLERARERGALLEAADLHALAAGLTGLGVDARAARTTLLQAQEHLIQAPFYAVPVKASITFTMGGLAVDEGMRVLAQGSVPLPGLYAAGCDVGDISHTGYLGGLATALVTGRVAGAAASLS